VVRNAVNMPSLSEEEQRMLAPYLLLAERMGRFIGQTMRPGYSRITVGFEGGAASINRKPLINSILLGLLSGSMEEVNAVNAGMLARERGIEINETARDSSENFSTMLHLEVEGDEGVRSISGTLFDETRPRLIRFDTCDVEIAPTGNLIFLQNEDRPGVIAAVGRILAEANINIGDFRLGRREDTRNAVALIQVDSPPNDEVLKKLETVANVLMVRYAELGDMA